MNTEVMFSTGNNNWSTPQLFFDRLNSVFHFTLDPCAKDFDEEIKNLADLGFWIKLK